MSLSQDEALTFLNERIERYERTGDREAVLGPGVMARAGRLWHTALSPGGCSVEIGHALARLHWARDEADDSKKGSDLWEALLFYARIGNVDPSLVPEEPRQLLAAGVQIDHSFLGPEHWGRLAIRLLKEGQVTEGRTELDEAIELFGGTVEAYPQEHRFWSGDMSNLSLALRMRYDRCGDPSDLDRATVTARAAVRATDPADASLPNRLDNLSTALQAQANRSGDFVAAAEAARLGSRAVRATPPTDRRRLLFEENLAGARLTRFRLTRDLDELRLAVEELHAVVAATPGSDLDLARRRATLGGALYELFVLTRDPHQLGQAVELLTQAADRSPFPGLRLDALSDLSSVLLSRFQETGSQQDLDHAVYCGEESVKEAGTRDPRRSGRLYTWGRVLCATYAHTHEPRVLDEAIDAFRLALDGLGPGHPRRAPCEASLGQALMDRQFRLRDDITPFGISELRADAARLQWEQIRNTQGPELLSTELGGLQDLAEAHAACLRAVAAAGPRGPDLGTHLRGLSSVLYSRYRLLGEESDADRAVELAERALQSTPAQHAGRASVVLQLARFLTDLRGHAGAGRALSLWQGLASDLTAPPWARASAAAYAARYLARSGAWGAATDQYAQALGILPSLVSSAKERTAQENELTAWSGLSAEAASCAVAAGDPERAMELLEQGRSVLWAQLLDLRDGLDALDSVDGELADRLARLERELNAPPETASANPWWDRIADRRLTLVAERDELLARIRRLPGLGDFRKPAAGAELRGAASRGPVVMVVSSQWRTDALIVTTTTVRAVELDRLTYQGMLERTARYLNALAQYEEGPRDAIARVKLNLLVTSTLKWLWHDIAEPVLTALGHTGAPPAGRPRPRLWWCPTGPLALLPLHAAGLPDSASPDGTPDACVLDRVTPSYTPTVRALLANRQATPRPGTTDRMLVVGMPVTPGHLPLPQVAGELTALREAIPRATVLQGERATRQAVRDALRTHRWVHLSCHGGQQLLRPSEGGLVLHDEMLTIADLRADRHAHGEFAFLSACKTALGGAAVPDEAINVASAFQYAGWQQVIGTLWSVGTIATEELSGDLYRTLVRGGTLRSEGIAAALNDAVRRLRAAGHPPLVWAPFAHVGG
ncbi:CHAT domain-containing protein [Streptomyces sp. NBC_01217]|uniref:CHAT domain-containing protein n=1 Tax=Streptomyces sp. NBC_01217 TaxID=2903779 RepID=UPI002E156615|nr:CHAT domain-containing protein [Streptomyces sp. NBC_01217]